MPTDHEALRRNPLRAAHAAQLMIRCRTAKGNTYFLPGKSTDRGIEVTDARRVWVWIVMPGAPTIRTRTAMFERWEAIPCRGPKWDRVTRTAWQVPARTSSQRSAGPMDALLEG
jgi:hypothetical protein